MNTLAAALLAASLSFQSLADFKPALAPVASERAVSGAPVAPIRTRTLRTVRLSGNVSLNGTAYAGQGTSNVYVNFSGGARLDGSDGRTSSGYTSINESEFFWLNSGSFVSGYVHPSTTVSVYRDGKYVGQARVSGTIFVTGYNNNGWVNLSGSGTLSGDVTVED